MKKLRKNKKFVMISSIALALVMVLSATFAWFSAQDSVDNEFKTGGIPTDSVKVWEIFKKPDEWKPGQKVQKDVGVANLGKEPIFVRASFKEVMTKLESDGTNLTINTSATLLTDANNIPVPVSDLSSSSDWTLATTAGYSVTGLGDNDKLYVKEATNSDGTKQVFYSAVSSQGGAIKATFDLDADAKAITATGTLYEYYTKADEQAGNWIQSPFVADAEKTTSKIDSKILLGYHDENMATDKDADKWFYNEADGWFYYTSAVKGGAITPFFLGSVTLDGEANNSYQYLDYKLTVSTEGIQGTPEALATWGITSGSDLYNTLTASLK